MHARNLRRRPRDRHNAWPTWVAAALLIGTTALLPACGGGGGGGGGGPAIAPANLSYDSSNVVYRTDDPITPNTPSWTGGNPIAWQVTPALPSGLTLGTDGVISGTCTSPVAAADYDVTAGNANGSTVTTVNIEIIWHESKSLTPKAVVTDADIRHFLDRTHFGFSQTHYDAVNAQGFATYVDGMTTFADTSQLELDGRNAHLVDVNDPNGEFPSEGDLARYWLYLMMNNPNPFQENLALKFHDHFACGSQVLNGAARYYYETHINLWRHNGTGDMRQLYIDMSRDWAMLVWLDGINNRDNAPNENYSREFFELYLLGVDIEYTQQDIVEGARAFTGYRQRFDNGTGLNFIEFDPDRHDYGSKTVLGQVIPAQTFPDPETDYVSMVDVTLAVNEAGTGASRVGQWMARSMLEYFCFPNPSQNLIDDLGNALRDGGWQMKPVLMTLFQSEAFFSAQAREAFVKGPVEHVLGFIRATALTGSVSQIDSRLEDMGHRVSQPSTVGGWPGGTQWLGAQSMVDRANMLNYLTEQQQSTQGGLGITALDLLPAPNADSAATVDALVVLLNIQLSAAERTTLITYLDTERDSAGNVTPDPFDPVGNPNEAESRVRGLLWILGQHPTYHIR